MHISQLIRYSRACISYYDYLIEAFYWRWSSYWGNCFYWLRWSHILESLRSPPWLVSLLRNSCVTNDHEYAMFVVHDYRRVGSKSNTRIPLCYLQSFPSLILLLVIDVKQLPMEVFPFIFVICYLIWLC